MRKTILLRFLLLLAVWLGGCCGIAAAIILGLHSDSPAEIFAGVVFIGFFVLLILLAVTDHRLQNEIEQDPELIPPEADEETLRAWSQADAVFDEKLRRLDSERKNLRLLGIVITPLLAVLFIISEINFRDKIRKYGLHPGSPVCALRAYMKRCSSFCGWIGFAVMLIAVFMILFSAMYAFVAHSKTTVLNSSAKMLFHAVTAYQTDLEYDDQDYRLQTVIINGSDPGPNLALHEGIRSYFNDADRMWYALICDKDGYVTGTLCANHPITQDAIDHPQTFEEQYAYMKSPFRKDLAAVGADAPKFDLVSADYTELVAGMGRGDAVFTEMK